MNIEGTYAVCFGDVGRHAVLGREITTRKKELVQAATIDRKNGLGTKYGEENEIEGARERERRRSWWVRRL